MVGRLKKMMKNWLFNNSPRVTVPAYFMYFEGIIVCRSTRRAGSLSEKAYNVCIQEF